MRLQFCAFFISMHCFPLPVNAFELDNISNSTSAKCVVIAAHIDIRSPGRVAHPSYTSPVVQFKLSALPIYKSNRRQTDTARNCILNTGYE